MSRLALEEARASRLRLGDDPPKNNDDTIRFFNLVCLII